ncbi:uncharacterized protein LOC118762678 [Octopus sinensis]|uniref:Uncharacterized protein LOC118762678 n=1 Tax=Octopus sinensis TaxID=2607531 RepID=A0A7E6EPE4_9MOLL|nr:uncharacterized protein LOC118762678 [Octopus sinensis]
MCNRTRYRHLCINYQQRSGLTWIKKDYFQIWIYVPGQYLWRQAGLWFSCYYWMFQLDPLQICTHRVTLVAYSTSCRGTIPNMTQRNKHIFTHEYTENECTNS